MSSAKRSTRRTPNKGFVQTDDASVRDAGQKLRSKVISGERPKSGKTAASKARMGHNCRAEEMCADFPDDQRRNLRITVIGTIFRLWR